MQCRNTRHISDCGRSIQICLCLSVVSSGFQFQEPEKTSSACNMSKIPMSIPGSHFADSEDSNDQGRTTAILVLKSFHCFENDRQCTIVCAFALLPGRGMKRVCTNIYRVLLWMRSDSTLSSSLNDFTLPDKSEGFESARTPRHS